MIMTTILQKRVRESGNMAPSLLNEEATDPNDGFEEAVTRILDGNNGTLNLKIAEFCIEL